MLNKRAFYDGVQFYAIFFILTADLRDLLGMPEKKFIESKKQMFDMMKSFN